MLNTLLLDDVQCELGTVCVVTGDLPAGIVSKIGRVHKPDSKNRSLATEPSLSELVTESAITFTIR